MGTRRHERQRLVTNTLSEKSGFLLSESDIVYAKQSEAYGIWRAHPSQARPVPFLVAVTYARAPAPTADDWVTSELLGLVDLEENWDGYGAHPPTPVALRLVSKFLKSWSAQPCRPWVMGTPEGGVILEWETEDVDLILEFGEIGQTNAYARMQHVECEGPVHEHWNIIFDALDRLWFHD